MTDKHSDIRNASAAGPQPAETQPPEASKAGTSHVSGGEARDAATPTGKPRRRSKSSKRESRRSARHKHKDTPPRSESESTATRLLKEVELPHAGLDRKLVPPPLLRAAAQCRRRSLGRGQASEEWACDDAALPKPDMISANWTRPAADTAPLLSDFLAQQTELVLRLAATMHLVTLADGRRNGARS